MNYIGEIEKQLNNLLAKRSEPILRVAFILSQLDFSFIENRKMTKFSLHSIARLYLFRFIKGLKNYEKLPEYFNANRHDEAYMMGFYTGDDQKVELPIKRTFNNCMKLLDKNLLNQIAEKILATVTKNHKLLDLEITRKALQKKKETFEKETKEAVELVKKLFYPNINWHIHHNAKFGSKDFLDVLTHVASQGDFANNGAVTFRALNPERKAPSGDLMLYHFSKFEKREDILNIFDNLLDVIFKFAKNNYNVLRNRFHDIAYDIHKIPYYGKKASFTCGDKFERGTSEFIEFLTCSILEGGRRFIIDVIPIHQFFDLSMIIERSLMKVKQKIKINHVYCDRGFNRAKIFKVLKNQEVKFLMPMTKNYSVKKIFDDAEFVKAFVKKDFAVGKEKVNLILVDDEKGVKRAFVCNFPVEEEKAQALYTMYSKRWGIETGYRNLDHDFRPRTTTRNYNIRLFYFLFSCCLYNLWVLVNICVGLTVHGRIKEKPIITAKLFAIILYQVKVTYKWHL